ncbi:hypothetical protein SAMN05421805_101675 [Saccharopolyspora antimicrobica]|uniref:Uncharacterized protein n=1 Tax=Saccharopolyspora antimicrobica TaxID=455193 RepID=A0A1I4RT55_9PSEU|nr:hypothetical protein [Saccharopolyspora antimicrobica]RKT87895.1 hypothetical protein ATL45_6317 [Saccharopolyspora antimicrobica]SFM55200.1 hypothetical protein SAMN05421805_101675 [Saccharopolyspora antimicrobica]
MFQINRLLLTGVLSLPLALGVAGLVSNRFQQRKPTSKARHRRDRTTTLRRTEGGGKPHIFLIKSTDETTRASTTNAGPAMRFKVV